MLLPHPLRILLLASLSILPLQACAILTTARTDGSVEAAHIANRIGHVKPSSRDTCETQADLAAQSSRIDSIATGKEVVYKPAPCAEAKPAEPKTEPKTS